MGKIVVLKLEGDLEQQGFPVSLEVADDGLFPDVETDGYLPPNPDLAEALQQWQTDYQQLVTSSSRVLKPKRVDHDGFILPFESCKQSAKHLEQLVRQWFHSPTFREIELKLRDVVTPQDSIRILIRTSNRQLHRLPWHVWDLLKFYPKAEVAMGTPRFRRSLVQPNISPHFPRVRILAVLGDRTGINIDADHHLLSALPDAEVEELIEPSQKQFHDALWEQPWDILFFAGHSETIGDQGILKLNSETMLTIEDITFGVGRAIANGLQLAIFNSCDGLGLAQELEALQLPQMIVMRESVPDRVAQTFLEYFLQSFAQGASLYEAQRDARERLQGLEDQFPCASWLPILYQHPTATTLTWEQIKTARQPTEEPSPPPAPEPAPPIPLAQKLARAAATSFMVTSVVMGVRLLGGLQALELAAYDVMMRSRPIEPADDRIVLVTIDEPDLAYQKDQGMTGWGSLSDEALELLLAKLNQYHPRVIGLDIYRDRPVDEQQSALQTYLQDMDNFVAVCQIGGSDRQASNVEPPPEVPVERVGFSDIPYDAGNNVRRHLLGMSPDGQCETSQSFSYRLAIRYLASDIDEPDFVGHVLQVGSLQIPSLRSHQAAYHQRSMGGYQIMLNYRNTSQIAPSISLVEILSQEYDPELERLLRDRIVLIGTIAESYKDYHFTPLGERSGVEIQAQMISQLISAVQDGRSLIWYWPQWADALWTLTWAIVGGGLAIVLQRRWQQVLALGIGIVVLTGSCFAIFCLGGWIPWIPAILSFVITTSILALNQSSQSTLNR